MTSEEPPLSATSPLDKPLHHLTEEDFSQITREQCRQYLKQKGMRRPSWNKSQAIQQVIMLKALLEPSPESDAFHRKFHITHRLPETAATRLVKALCNKVLSDHNHEKLAASPLQFLWEASIDGNVTTSPPTRRLQASSITESVDSSAMPLPTLQTGTT